MASCSLKPLVKNKFSWYNVEKWHILYVGGVDFLFTKQYFSCFHSFQNLVGMCTN